LKFQGQSLGLVGNNGAGTTFLLFDLIQPSTGSILNNGLVNARRLEPTAAFIDESF
jgi:ABC-type polysaccharide/polyol phosphate transport system ATPase subunit